MPPEKEHGCEWQEYAKKLEERLAKLEEAVRNRRGHRSEKRPKTAKMPPPIAPAPAEPAPRAEDDLRHAKLEVEPQNLTVPKKQRVCPACDSRELRTVGAGKTSTIYDYVAPHFRKRVCHRETLACACGEYIVTAPAPERVGVERRGLVAPLAHPQMCGHDHARPRGDRRRPGRCALTR